MKQSNRQHPRVAIVTPVYNGEQFLAETMACVQTQTYPNLLHIVLDNASVDSTPDIIARYRNGRVPLVTRRNPEVLSMYDNWETSLRLIGPDVSYFLILCADDLITDDAIEKLVDVAEVDPDIGVVGCQWTTGTQPGGDVDIHGKGLPTDMAVFDGRWFVKTYLTKFHSATSPQCQLFRRSLLRDDVPFHKYDEMLMDIDVCLRAAVDGKYGFVHAPLGFTREHADRTTSTVRKLVEDFTSNWLALINRHGPSVMSAADLVTCRRAYLQHYFRRLLLWRFRDGNKKLYDHHLAILKEQGIQPSPLNYVEALLVWAWQVARGNRGDVGAATSLWPKARLELSEMVDRPTAAADRRRSESNC
ncbi:glycosyltransferase family 2 protein [Bradyrhizobium sp. BWA-3-5]|uniref:glycosyltransferase family A protein n=1 Tax=Bradyrhizobium sp. BWA-3-5 TaxID=3080013 RepID=UPI00293E9DDC|nr:glycosyltransferase family 2 protein [Bradyrhizobium sp. BWA-3-5]WOH68048.1 glycosyltransferase family 2 protein [Bradyrhizobium sp. BWA-3-5]